MHPWALVVAGFALLVLDLRINGFDLTPDLVGWLVIAWGLSRLAPLSRWFGVTVVVAVTGALLAVPMLFLEPEGVLADVVILVETAFVFGTCTAVIDAAGSDPRVRTTANWIRWTDLVLTLGAFVLVQEPPPPGLLVLLVVAALGVAAWFMVFLLSLRAHPTFRDVGAAVTGSPS